MRKKITLDELMHFSQNEKELFEDLVSHDFQDGYYHGLKVNKSAVNILLNYSKVLSVRPSKLIGEISIVLN